MSEIKYPKGYPYRVGFTKIAIALPNKLFAEIVAMAKEEGKEFNAMVVELCEVGKFDLNESDAHEPEKKDEHSNQPHSG